MTAKLVLTTRTCRALLTAALAVAVAESGDAQGQWAGCSRGVQAEHVRAGAGGLAVRDCGPLGSDQPLQRDARDGFGCDAAGDRDRAADPYRGGCSCRLDVARPGGGQGGRLCQRDRRGDHHREHRGRTANAAVGHWCSWDTATAGLPRGGLLAKHARAARRCSQAVLQGYRLSDRSGDAARCNAGRQRWRGVPYASMRARIVTTRSTWLETSRLSGAMEVIQSRLVLAGSSIIRCSTAVSSSRPGE